MPEEQGNVEQAKQINIGTWVSKAWDLVTADLANFLILGLIFAVIVGVAATTAIGQFLVIGPLSVGFYLIIFKRMRGEELNVGDIAKGFNHFVPSVLANILISAFVAIGLALCIIPGLLIAALYLFTYAFILEQKLDFWEAMEASRKVLKDHLFEMTIFVLLLGLINFVGVLLCGIGVIFTIPLTTAATAIAYDDLVGIDKG